MNELRIVQVKRGYIVERRYWLFGWMNTYSGGIDSMPTVFRTLEEAEDAKKEAEIPHGFRRII